jgi:hypothetical protein
MLYIYIQAKQEQSLIHCQAGDAFAFAEPAASSGYADVCLRMLTYAGGFDMVIQGKIERRTSQLLHPFNKNKPV